MSRGKVLYICQGCGGVHPKWTGQCQHCLAWNTLSEEIEDSIPKQSLKKGHLISFTDLASSTPPPERHSTGMAEFDRVCGGGLVPGSVLLVGGDPGIGKSTLLLQVTAQLAKSLEVYYISGEEAVEQIRMRATRLGVQQANVHLATATSMNDIITSLEKTNVDLVIIDSIQTMYSEHMDAAPGTVGQVRLSTQALTRFAKKRGVVVIIVGHVTKEGTLAGPRVLEHMVDTVLYFEGERGHQFRILRGVKNRFGATDEIGVFEMTEKGLQEVLNPSALFLSSRDKAVSGSAVFAGIEGTRPILSEIQGLVAQSNFAAPRRAVVGWDSNRLAMLIAVLQKRCSINMGSSDVYLNVAGGLKIQEPAADLAVAAALMSSLTGQALPEASLFLGEIGLSGEIRTISHLDARLKEAEKLGFKKVFMPSYHSTKGNRAFSSKLEICALETLGDLVQLFDKEEASYKAPRKEKHYGT
jgi:DNA repair protein RadA/Sms